MASKGGILAFGLPGDGRDDPIACPVQLVGDQHPVLWPDDPVVGDPVALKQQEEVQRVLALVAR